MAGPGRVEERLTKVEVTLSHLEQKVDSNRNATSGEIKVLREDINDKIEEIVTSHAQVEHELKSKMDKDVETLKKELTDGIGGTNRRIDLTNIEISNTNQLLGKINNKLTIHSFVFSVVAAIAIAAIGGLFKSLFDHIWE